MPIAKPIARRPSFFIIDGIKGKTEATPWRKFCSSRTRGSFGKDKESKVEKIVKFILALTFVIAIPAHAQGQNADNGYNDAIPKGAIRKGDRYPYDPRFPKEEIKFIGEVNGKTVEYENVMDQYLSPETKADVKKRKMQWLIVRYPTRDMNYRAQIDDKTVEQAVIVDMRYVPYVNFLSNGTLNVVFNVKEVEGVPKEFHFVKMEYDEPASAALGDTAVGAKDLAKAVLTDVINRVYGLTPVNKPN